MTIEVTPGDVTHLPTVTDTVFVCFGVKPSRNMELAVFTVDGAKVGTVDFATDDPPMDRERHLWCSATRAKSW